MPDLSQQNITLLLEDCSNGNKNAVNELLPIVYNELRRISSKYLNDEYRNHTLQTTELVHEAYIKLVDEHKLYKNYIAFVDSYLKSRLYTQYSTL